MIDNYSFANIVSSIIDIHFYEHMAEITHLSKAPIQEAVIAIRVANSPEKKKEEIEAFCNELTQLYPQKEPLITQEIFFTLNKEGTNVSQKERNTGFKLTTADTKYVVQINARDIVLSRLHPYVDGNELIANYQQLWELYVKRFSNVTIERIGLRYINIFKLPLDKVNDYILLQPNLVQENSQPLNYGLVESRYMVNSPKSNCNAAIQYQLLVNGDHAEITFDIDVYDDIPKKYQDFNSIKPFLDKFRALKNLIFFDNITVKAVDYFK